MRCIRFLCCAVALALAIGQAHAGTAKPDPALEAAETALRAALQELAPQPSFEYARASGALLVKYKTRKFMVYGMSMIGEYNQEAREEEGPQYNGFLLSIHLQEAGTVNAPVVPQTIRRPYWQTDLDIVVCGRGKQLYWALSYGTSTSPAILKQVRDALQGLAVTASAPRSRQRPTTRKSTRATGAAADEHTTMSESRRIEMLQPPSKRPVRMVLDTDTYNEIDDQFAVVYALISPEVSVQAVYAAPFHNNRSSGPGDGMEKSYEEILRILAKLGKSPDGFAFKGSTNYITDPQKPERSPAALDLIERARESSPQDPLYVAAVGAITNVASAILIEPSIIQNIVVVWLGGNAHHWPHQREFNLRQDLKASRVIFDSGVPFVQLPCTPVVTHFATTVPEMERYVGGRGPIGDYLLTIFKDYHKDHFAWSKVLWDMTAVAWLVNDRWLPSDLVHSPIVTDNYTFSFDPSRHFIRCVNFVNRDPIFRDFFTKLDKRAKGQ
jgi:purine nucleosidase